MKKILFTFLAICLLINPFARADEGMWLPMFVSRLNYVDMQKEGLHLTAEEIYSINNSSLKDAIIQFGNGCTGEIVSNEGLIFTNHHCGYGSIQSHSTTQNDYLTNGFWAMNKNEELPNEGLTARFLVRMEDLTKEFQAQLKGIKIEKERTDKIAELIKKYENSVPKDNGFEAVVKTFFNGNEFYMFVYQVFKDVRLVGAPPSSIGKFGADTDNWMWPRHTCDFSIFRVYMSPEGKSATFSKDNVPYKPKHFLPISGKGVKKGDYAMIMGYPGTTDRYLTSYGVQLNIDVKNPNIVKIREEKLAIMRQFMNADPAVRIQYASKYAQTANYWKYFIGQTKGLKRLKVYDKKKELENQFETWVNSNAQNKEKYGTALTDISAAYAELGKFELQRWYFQEAIARGPEIIGFSRNFSALAKELKAEKPDNDKIKKAIDVLKTVSEKFFKDYNQATDKKLLASMLNLYFTNVPKEQQPELLSKIASKCKGNFAEYTEVIFKKTIFSDVNKVNNLLSKPNAKAIEKDMAYVLMNAFYDNYFKYNDQMKQYNEMLERGNRLFVAGIREMQPDKKFAPNANSTMRVTYGQVLDYYPADAVHYDYKTTLDGVMEKEDPNNWEFVVPAKLKDLFMKKDFGDYAENGKMPVAFLSNTDITGGNSGSPVINGDGELIGLAFDGNWEAMSGDIAFEPNLQRTISVDVRYVLFIIDKYAGAKNLINELVIKR
ncbi:MAG: S46 family peptidase [Bacteroidetes bacterium]|nr:S46 family peptidase [Bacteroidota bacterium]